MLLSNQMKLPYRNNSYVPRKKLTDYLLSETHPVGRLKAKFFTSIGFDLTNVTKLEQSLLNIAYDQDIKEVIPSQYGKKYIIDGKLQSPAGNTIRIRTVWILEKEKKRPRFITAYPI